jgi:CheY-like chemotaxis protein
MDQHTVLVIDDDDDLREMICLVLEDAGYAAVPMPGGEPAVEYLRHAEPPDLIILDLMMPGMDGWRVREKLLELPRVADVPVVVATASRAIDRHPVDAAAILYKPFSSRELLDAVARFSRIACP